MTEKLDKIVDNYIKTQKTSGPTKSRANNLENEHKMNTIEGLHLDDNQKPDCFNSLEAEFKVAKGGNSTRNKGNIRVFTDTS